MKKIIFVNIPHMNGKIEELVREVGGNSSLEYGQKTYYPINGVLAKTLEQSDKVSVVLLQKEDKNGVGDGNAERFRLELNRINETIGSSVEYKTLKMPDNEERKTQENMLQAIVGELEENAKIYADITFGAKSFPIIIFSALNFAERFFKSDINIYYGDAKFKDGKIIENSGKLCDLTALFYLNSIANTIECKTGEESKIILKKILEG